VTICPLFLDVLMVKSSFLPPPLSPSPSMAMYSKEESIARDLRCPFSERNNAWIVGFDERSLWLLLDP